jgi:hypothetical protein
MQTSTLRRAAALLALVAVAASCSGDSLTAPAPDAHPEVHPGLLDGGLIGGIGGAVDDLLSCRVAATSSTTQSVGPEGGTITVGRHSLVIPAGALRETVEITATAPAGEHVELRFAPHGLVFDRRVALRMSYAECGLVRALLLRIAYVDPEKLEILEVLPSFPDLLRRQVYGTTDHFSSYMLAY